MVRVAGFEPAASSSQSQLTVRAASVTERLTWDPPSVSVRRRPLLAVALVTHFVTPLLTRLFDSPKY